MCEPTETFIWTAHTETVNLRPIHWLEKSDEIVYVSERDGWRHLYLIDAKEGDQSLCDFTIRLLAETGTSADDVFIFDPFHPYGSPQQDFL